VTHTDPIRLPDLPPIPLKEPPSSSSEIDQVIRWAVAVREAAVKLTGSDDMRAVVQCLLFCAVTCRSRRPGPEHDPRRWLDVLGERLRRAPKGTMAALDSWRERVAMAMLRTSSQSGEGEFRIIDLKQILDAVDEGRLKPRARQTLQRIRRSHAEGWCRHVTAWEGVEQIIVPLPPLDELFEDEREYSAAEVGEKVGLDARSVKKRISGGTLPRTAGSTVGDPRMTGRVLNDAVSRGVFDDLRKRQRQP
jgi:hypothetical protein